MRRHLAIALLACCVLLAAAATAMWVRSYWRFDWLTHNQLDRTSQIRSWRGRVFVDTIAIQTPNPTRNQFSRFGGVPVRAGDDSGDVFKNYRDFYFFREFLGFAYFDFRGRARMLAIPYWSLALPPLVPPAIALLRARRRRWRQRHAHCLTCGYDLRASQDRCPECGTAIPA